MYTAVLYSLAETSQPPPSPPPPAFGLIEEIALGQLRQPTSLCKPLLKWLTFVDEGVEVAPEDEQPNEEEVEEDAEGECDPGEDLPGPPGPRLVVGLLRGSLPGLLPVQNLNHAFFRSLQGA
jgi:hypothetical protein